MHGGADGSGAPPGNQNALKHGRFTRKAISERRALRDLIREFETTLERFEED
jgi:glucans biosynthesis protein